MQKPHYTVYTSRSGRYWLDVQDMLFADVRKALNAGRRCHQHGYTCWHIVRIQDGLVIAQSRNARV